MGWDGLGEVGGCLNHAGCKTPQEPRELSGNGIFEAVPTILNQRVVFYLGAAKAVGLKPETLCRSRVNSMFFRAVTFDFRRSNGGLQQGKNVDSTQGKEDGNNSE